VATPPPHKLDCLGGYTCEEHCHSFSRSDRVRPDPCYRKKSKQVSELISSMCGVETAPLFAGSLTGTKWEILTSKYPQHVCQTLGCQKRIRTYCRCCMVGNWMCPPMHWYPYSISRCWLVSEACNSVCKKMMFHLSFDLYNFLSIRAFRLLLVTKMW
jgi:hypothetical protein